MKEENIDDRAKIAGIQPAETSIQEVSVNKPQGCREREWENKRLSVRADDAEIVLCWNLLADLVGEVLRATK